jgi:hypothetical protein
MKRWLILLLMGAAGCKGSDANFLAQADATPSGYTATDANGNVLKADSDDWRISPQYSGEISIKPAYPNPTTTAKVTIPITIIYESATAVQFWGESNNGSAVLLTTIPTPITPGPYSIVVDLIRLSPSLNLNDLKGELKRIKIYDQAGNIISYGDIQIQ